MAPAYAARGLEGNVEPDPLEESVEQDQCQYDGQCQRPEAQHEHQQRNGHCTAGQHPDKHEQQTNEAHQVHGAILLVG